MNNTWPVIIAQSCLTLCDPVDCGSSVHGILQARILQWVAIPFSGVLPHSGIEPMSPTQQADSVSSEPPEKPHLASDHSKTQLLPTLIISNMVLRMKPRCWLIQQRIPAARWQWLMRNIKQKQGLSWWLRRCASNTGAAGSIPGWRTGIPHAVWCGGWGVGKGLKMKPPSCHTKGYSFTHHVTRGFPS